MGEQILKDCVYSNAGLSVIALRYFNPVGAHKSGMLGELSQGTPKHLFPIINHSIEEDRPVLIFGDNYDTLDGTPVRDYIHVTDLALAHVSALSKLRNLKNQYRAYNIGTGKGLSVKEIIQAYAEILNKPIKHEILSRRTGDAEKIWADVERAEKELNWKAKNGLKEMILSSLKWEETQKDLFS